MWDEIQDMMGEIFDFGDVTDDIPSVLSFDCDIDDRDAMPLDMQDDIEKEDPLLDDWWTVTLAWHSTQNPLL